jgi:type VI secretion system protein ImpD/type VI secretion system protein ImpC
MLDAATFTPGGSSPEGAAMLRGRVDRLITAIERRLGHQLDAILHHARFRALEGSWRGLAWLAASAGSAVKLTVLAASWREIARDFDRAVEFDGSHLFRLVYDNEFGHPGGEPFGLLVIDQEVCHQPPPRRPGEPAAIDDIAVLAGLSAVASAAFAPLVLSASPALFGADDWDDLALSADIIAPLGDDEHARWRAFAAREDTRFVSVVLPRVLARPRWSDFVDGRNGLRYEEHAPAARERTWFAASYAFAACVARAVRDHAWPADVRGVRTDRIGGGLVVDLPQEPFRFGPGTHWNRPTVSLGLTDPQERALVQAGFMPLNSLPQGDAAFVSATSLQTDWLPPPGRDPSPGHVNRHLSAQTNAILCVSRFAHYVKMIAREMVGSALPPEQIERRLQSWLGGYMNSNPASSDEARARFPLLSARATVHEIPGRPGHYGCVLHLQPHHQLDDVSTTFRLVTGFSAGPTHSPA